MERNALPCSVARPGELVFLPGNFRCRPGWVLRKIGENGFDFSRRARTLPPLRKTIGPLSAQLSAKLWRVAFAGREWVREVDFAPAEKRAFSLEDFRTAFSSGLPDGWKAGAVEAAIEGAFFVPASLLKELRREFWIWAEPAFASSADDGGASEGLYRFYEDAQTHTLPTPPEPFPYTAQSFSIPAFVPESGLAELRRQIRNAWNEGIRLFRAGGPHAIELLAPYPEARWIAQPPFWAVNSQALRELAAHGCAGGVISPELPPAAEASLRAGAALPLAPFHGETVLLATRLPLPEGVWTDETGRRYQVKRAKDEPLFLVTLPHPPEPADDF